MSPTDNSNPFLLGLQQYLNSNWSLYLRTISSVIYVTYRWLCNFPWSVAQTLFKAPHSILDQFQNKTWRWKPSTIWVQVNSPTSSPYATFTSYFLDISINYPFPCSLRSMPFLLITTYVSSPSHPLSTNQVKIHFFHVVIPNLSNWN